MSFLSSSYLSHAASNSPSSKADKKKTYADNATQQDKANAYDYSLRTEAERMASLQNAQAKQNANNSKELDKLKARGGFGTDAIAPTTTSKESEVTATSGDTTETSNAYAPSTASFTPSNTYLKAMEYTNSLLQQLSSGRTSYTDQINALMNQIQNRDAFSYDMDTDTLFQNSLQSAMASGKVAMQDTMGQASALTGGYGSTYATSAANQAYNGYIQDAYANLPDYYNLALEAYNMEGQNLYNQLGMYQDADNTEYSRLANAYSANMQNAADMYDNEYNNYWQTQNFNENSRQFNANLAYKNAQQAQDQANWEKEYELSLAKASVAADETATSSKLTQPTQTMKDTAKALYEQYGDKAGSEYRNYMNSLDDSYDIAALDAWVTSTVDKGITLSKKNWVGAKDNTYTNRWGDEYSYQDLLDMGYTVEQIKALKKSK